jgi:hypothetical protein
MAICPHCQRDVVFDPMDLTERHCTFCGRFFDEEGLVQSVTGELSAKPHVFIDSMLVFQLVALVQQAMLDPRLTPELHEVGERFIGTARDFFADCPSVLDILRRGPKTGHSS